MARHKNAAALFEVINKNKSRGPGLFSSLGRMFHSRSTGTALPAAPAPAPVVSEAPAPVPEISSRVAASGTGVETRRGEVLIRLSYTSAVIGAFAMATVVGGAFLAGERMQAVRPALSGQSTPEIRSGPALPGVVKVISRTEYDPLAEDMKAAGSPKPAEAVAKGGKRSAGLNYVIIQSYPKLEMAQEAKKVLEEKGIEATIEQHLPNWGINTSWYTVVGTWGFPRNISNSTEYTAYIKAIKAVSDGYAKHGSFKAFDPRPYKWGVKEK